MTESELAEFQDSIKSAVFIDDEGRPEIVIQRGTVRITMRPYGYGRSLHVCSANGNSWHAPLNRCNLETAMRELLA